MITLDRKAKRIRWEEGDAVQMSRILGAEDAMKLWAPPVASIIKLAVKKGMMVHKDARAELEAAELWRKKCKALQDLKDADIPDKKAAKYFPHQRADLKYIYETNLPSYLVTHETGVGKTVVGIRFAEFREARRIAVITPNTAKDQWRDEIVRFRDRKMPIYIVEGSAKEQTKLLASGKPGWYIGHWESLVHAREGWLDDEWGTVIGDEIQWIQNRNAQRTETFLAMPRESLIGLTAHPFSNAIEELFPLLQAAYPDLYPSFWRWAHMHIKIQAQAFGGLNLQDPRRPKLLAWEIRPFVMRRAKKDVYKDLPPVARLRRVVELTPKGRREYEKLRKQFFVELAAHAGEKRILAIPSVLARITRLRQYLIDPDILGAKEKSVKYPAVIEILDEVRKPTVIFTAYREAAERLHAYLTKRKLRTELIVGGMRKRIKPIKKKFLRGQLDAVIILISVGGTALNFGKYGYYIDLDLPWNPRDFEQIEGRVDRPEEGTGKLVATTGFRIVVKDSYEERMEDKITNKRGDFTKVFTVNTLREIFSQDDDEIESD